MKADSDGFDLGGYNGGHLRKLLTQKTNISVCQPVCLAAVQVNSLPFGWCSLYGLKFCFYLFRGHNLD